MNNTNPQQLRRDLQVIFLMTTAPPAKAPWGTAKKIPPLGLAYVGAALEKDGFQVEILDNYLLNKPINDVKQIVGKLSPEIVGIGCTSNTYQRCVETAKAVKEVLPSCKIVVGGPHPSSMPESMLQHPEIDYVVIGEGERAMVDLANSIRNGEDDSAIATIPGVAFKRERRIVKTAQSFIEDLDQIPYPARHLLPMHLYDREIDYLSVKSVDTMNVMRGCPYKCNWCNVPRFWGQKFRAFSPARVVAEIDFLARNYGTQGIYFVGDNFTFDKERTIQICELIRNSKLDIEWACDTAVNLISRDLLREMKGAGCRTLWFGVESGSPAILKKINRGITVQQVEHSIKLCKEEGIKTAISFMLGIPGETTKDRKATLELAKKVDPDWCHFNIIIAYPGCSLYQEILENHLYDRIEDFLAYVKGEDFNFESLQEVQKRFRRSFNRSPKRVLRKIRREGPLNVLKESLTLLSPSGSVRVR
jgi:anaerobic magnesium-protoporphyrin IX monomethyl ester cyclase